MSDYEHNLIIDSKVVSQKVLEDFEYDTSDSFSVEADPLEGLSLLQLGIASLHKILAPIIG